MDRPDPTSESAGELLAVAPLLADAHPGRRLVGPCLLVRSGHGVLGFASRSLVARGDARAVAVRLDGDAPIEIAEAKLSRYSGLMVFELREPEWPASDVVALDPSRVGAIGHAARGLPFLVGFREDASGFRRVPLRIRVEARETSGFGGSGDDVLYHVAYAREPLDPRAVFDGAPLLARHPASRALGRPAETLVYGVASALPHEADDDGEPGGRPIAELVPLPGTFGR